MSKLYKKVKRYHIQQDSPTGGSLAAFTVIRNTLAGKRKTQKGMRRDLYMQTNPWLTAVDGRKRNIFVRVFVQYVEHFFRLNMKSCKVRLVWSLEKTFEQFMQLLSEVDKNEEEKYIIFHHDGKYTPFGGLDENGNIILLDVDFKKVYGAEFTYKGKAGEAHLTPKHFYSVLKTQRRYVIVIERGNEKNKDKMQRSRRNPA